jgi:cytochrome c553
MTGRPPSPAEARGARLPGAALLVAAVLIAVAASSPLHAATTDASPGIDPGMRMYRDGILPSGKKMRAETAGGVVFTGALAACGKCHRRSGMGSSEGGTRVRPITGTALYRPAEVFGTGHDRKLPVTTRKYPPYTDESLARAIRDGSDPEGRRFDVAMPRYDLSDADMALLIGYLKSLSTAGAPGVTDNVIRFATVVDGRVSPARRNAVTDVLKTFFRDKNAGTRNEAGRARVAPWTDYRKLRAYRVWDLDVWELSGPEDTWEAQLEEHYRRNPVFALVSGVSAQGWGPVHRFCERHGIPCLFPNTDAPVASGPGYYTVYFSRGVMLEADALARHLGEGPDAIRRGPVVQAYRDDEVGRAAADAFRASLAASGVSDLRDVRLPANGDPPARILEGPRGGNGSATVVLWLPASDVRRIGERPWGGSPPGRIYLSSTLAGTEAAAMIGAPGGEVHVVHPFTLPKGKGAQDRIRIWLAARKVPPGDERLQANAFFAAGITGDALDRMLDFFSRDYMLEWVEHMTEESVNPSAYPRMSLGPGQRFGSKGSYILRYGPDDAGFAPVGGWIVPETR